MQRLFKGLLTGIFVGIVGTLIGLSPIGTQLEREVGLGWLFNIRGYLPSPENVAIVAINNRTGEQLGLPSLPRDWPRSIHAQLIDELVARGASVIVFDIHFYQTKVRQDDQKLIDSVFKSDRVVLVEQINGKRQPLFNDQGKTVGAVWVEELLQPFAELSRVTKGLGTFTLPKTEAAVHGFWVFKESARNAATLPAVALHLYATKGQKNSLISFNNQAEFRINDRVDAEEITQSEQLTSTMNAYRNRHFINEFSGQQSSLKELPQIPSFLKKMYKGSAYRFINFYGPPGTLLTVPYHAVINGSDPNVPAAHLDFTNKVVFVGYSDLYDPGQPDRFYTIYTNSDGVDLSGVEIAASSFANLLHEQSITLPSGYQSPIIVFVFGFCISVIAYLLPVVFGVTFSLVLAGLYTYLVQYYFSSDALWFPITTPILLELPMALFLGLFSQYFFERRRSQRISKALGYYLPEAAAQQLTQKSADHDSFNKVVYSTCLSTDMAGFSSIAEKMSPGELALMLNDYFDTLAEPLNKHHVDVTEFRADAIMCAWTAKQSNVEIRKKPILASLEAVESMQAFKQRYEMFNTGLRIGLEAGSIYIGHAGGGGHFVFSIVGDCANTASRIEGLNKHIGTQILATRTVIEGLDDLLVRYIGDFLFVNKSEPSAIYEIIALQNNATTDQFKLCEHYAEALHFFQLGEWKASITQLKSMLKTYPEDGPTQFLLNRAEHYLQENFVTENPGIIRMDVK